MRLSSPHLVRSGRAPTLHEPARVEQRVAFPPLRLNEFPDAYKRLWKALDLCPGQAGARSYQTFPFADQLLRGAGRLPGLGLERVTASRFRLRDPLVQFLIHGLDRAVDLGIG